MVSGRLGIGLGLGSGGAFFRGDFFLEPSEPSKTSKIKLFGKIVNG